MRKSKETGLDTIGLIHDDDIVSKFDIEGKPLIDLPDDCEPVEIIKEVIDKLI